MTDDAAETESKQIAVFESKNQVPEAFKNWTQGSQVFTQISTLAKKFSESNLCPDQFKGKETDCFIALQIAHRMGLDPFMTLQNLNVFKGKPSWSAQFAIALANERGPFSDKIKFKPEGEGATLKVKAYATLKETGETVSATVSMQMAIEEGWAGRNSKYKTMPEQMLTYRSGVFLVRRYAPELLLGIPTVDEAEDVTVASSRDVSQPDTKSKKLNQKIQEAKDGKEKSEFI